jgi:MYXO-CTERM domain-containing protein
MIPDCPPEVNARVFDATVVVVERAHYQCEVTPEGAAPGCIEARGTIPCLEGLVVALADGTTRSKQEQPPFVLEICDLPSGTHTATICTHDGPRSCTVDVSAGHGVGIAPTGSLPHRFQYRLRAADDAELVVYSDEVELRTGDRRRFSISPSARDPSLIGACNVSAIAPPLPRARGCGHCAASSPGFAVVLALAIGLAIRRRR